MTRIWNPKRVAAQNELYALVVLQLFILSALAYGDGDHVTQNANWLERRNATFTARLNSRDKTDRLTFAMPATVDLRTAEQKQRDGDRIPSAKTYGVIVDCGSSGTRAFLYSWDTEIDLSEQMLEDIEPLVENGRHLERKVTPGLSTFAEKSKEERERYIAPLMEFIAEKIPDSRHKYTGVYFLATAGMRLLSEQERESIMNDIEHYVKGNYKFAKVETSVISGTDEGMYQWISINMKSRRFLAKGIDVRTKTYAVVEMGGASIQVTYQLRNALGELQAQRLPNYLKPIYRNQQIEPAFCRSNIVKDNYELHSTTFLGFGINSAREAYLDVLIYEQQHKNPIVEWSKKLFGFGHGKTAEAGKTLIKDELHKFKDPCLARGYETEKSLKKPKIMLDQTGKEHKNILGYVSDENDSENNFEFKLVGTGSYEKCKHLWEKVIKLAKKEKFGCEKDEEDMCTMSLLGEKFVPFHRFEFLAIGSFYHAFTNVLIGDQDLAYDHDRIVRQTKYICQLPYNELKEKYGELIPEEHMLSACYRANWANVFLIKGLRMPPDFEMLQTRAKINGEELNWAQGAVLDKSIAIEGATEGLVV